MQGGASAEAMEDFTGGIVEVFNFKKEVSPNLFKIMKKAYDRSSMLGCTIDVSKSRFHNTVYTQTCRAANSYMYYIFVCCSTPVLKVYFRFPN